MPLTRMGSSSSTLRLRSWQQRPGCTASRRRAEQRVSPWVSPCNMDLYLPESWADNRIRCRVAHIPDEVVYRPKWRIALDLIERNVKAGVPLGLLLADSAFGDVGAFRDEARALGFDYALDVKCHTRVEIVGDDGSVTHHSCPSTTSSESTSSASIPFRNSTGVGSQASFGRAGRRVSVLAAAPMEHKLVFALCRREYGRRYSTGDGRSRAYRGQV